MILPLTSQLSRSVAQCHIESWRESFSRLVSQHLLDAFDTVRLAAQWDKSLLRADRRTLVAVDEGRVVGFVSVDSAAGLELHALYVRASLHGSGLADALLTAAIADEPCQLWVFDRNARAQAFYRRHGFAPDGEHRIEPFTGLTEMRMARPTRDIVGR
ncbi:GNAT family N-acetyltransferase [Skermania sp. ID1734]|nr:GNAT family N-acetyltransferase [Skermania sp. ID1734]